MSKTYLLIPTEPIFIQNQILYKNNIYNKSNSKSNSYYHCKTKNCKSRIILQNGLIIATNFVHSHSIPNNLKEDDNKRRVKQYYTPK